MKVLILGHGLLGDEIYKQTDWDCMSRKINPEFDFRDIDSYKNHLQSYDTILNCVAHTKTYSDEREKHWETNYKGVMDLVDFCNKEYYVPYSKPILKVKKLITISTDYIYACSPRNAKEEDIPVHNSNWYSYTKLLADAYVQARAKDYLMFRCSFKPRPWPYDNAIVSQQGNFDYVDVVAGQMIQLINKGATGVYNIGTENKTMYTLAVQTKPDVKLSCDFLHETMPRDISMNLNKFHKELQYG